MRVNLLNTNEREREVGRQTELLIFEGPIDRLTDGQTNRATDLSGAHMCAL